MCRTSDFRNITLQSVYNNLPRNLAELHAKVASTAFEISSDSLGPRPVESSPSTLSSSPISLQVNELEFVPQSLAVNVESVSSAQLSALESEQAASSTLHHHDHESSMAQSSVVS